MGKFWVVLSNVANFHKNTMKSFQEMVGALGLDDPSDLKPFHIMRRVAVNDVKPFNKIYDYLEPGQLLTDNIPDSYNQDWGYATADEFPK